MVHHDKSKSGPDRESEIFIFVYEEFHLQMFVVKGNTNTIIKFICMFVCT